MEFRVRHLQEADYLPLVQVADQWWGGRSVSHLFHRLFFVHFQSGSFLQNQSSIAFHLHLGFHFLPGDEAVAGVPVASNYDGHSGQRVQFVKSLS